MKNLIIITFSICTFNLSAQEDFWSISDHQLKLIAPEKALLSGYNELRKGDFNTAIEELTKALGASKYSHEYIYLFRGLAKYALGNYHQAEIDFTKCLFINSIMADAYFLRGMCRIAMHQEEEALADLSKTLTPDKRILTTSKSKVVDTIHHIKTQKIKRPLGSPLVVN